MRPETWKRVAWQLLGTLCYIAGLLVFLYVALEAFAGPSGEGLGGLTTHQLVLLGVSLLLVVVGGFVGRRFGGGFSIRGFDGAAGRGAGREQSVLEEYGYVTPEPDDDRPRYEYDDEGDVVYVYCPHCNARNDREFTYCRNCSGELST